MKSRCLLIVLSLCFCSPISFAVAGGSTSHGGDAVVCFRTERYANEVKERLAAKKPNPMVGYYDKVSSVELLDLYEARRDSLGQGAQEIVAPTGGFQAFLAERFENLRNTNVLLHDRVRDASLRLPIENWRMIETGVEAVDDSGEVIPISSKCVLIQLAIQKPVTERLFETWVDQRLFEKLNLTDQVGLVFHEWMYNFAVVERKDADSTFARRTNARIFNKSFVPARARSVAQYLERMDFFLKMRRSDIVSVYLYRWTCFAEDDCSYAYVQQFGGDPNREWRSYYNLSSRVDGLHSREAGLDLQGARCYRSTSSHMFGRFPVTQTCVDERDPSVAELVIDPAFFPRNPAGGTISTVSMRANLATGTMDEVRLFAKGQLQFENLQVDCSKWDASEYFAYLDSTTLKLKRITPYDREATAKYSLNGGKWEYVYSPKVAAFIYEEGKGYSLAP